MVCFPRSRNAAALAAAALALGGCSRAPQQPSQKSEKVSPAPVYFKVDPATAGAVTGKILFAGKKPMRKMVDMDEDPQCRKLHKTAVVNDAIAVNRNGTLANVFVYVKAGLEGKQFEPPAVPVTLNQKGCWFQPRIVGIQAGQALTVTNSDPVTHNVHPRPHANREWNQSQAPGEPPINRRFMRPEVMIHVKCNIHSWMHAWIGVVDHPYFAVTGTDGSFELRNLPPGAYTIEAWQEQLGNQEQPVTVSQSGKSVIDFTFQGAEE
jgi:plastocyanin